MKKITLSFMALLMSTLSFSQETKRALFLGNSYTAVNNLPQMVSNLAASAGDILLYDVNAPGCQTLQGHSSNSTSVNKIAAGNWNFVILQEQSQIPSLPENYVQTNMYPYAQTLNNLITTNNPCAETVFYSTWGRKNGDASNCPTWPPVCTFTGMNDLLSQRYSTMAMQNEAIISPVGAIWKYIRQQNPSIELYQPDESHPSIAGSYLAACCFYTVLFRKDPTLITNDYALPTQDAANIRAAAKLLIYDVFSEWHVGEYDPVANFNFTVTNNAVSFSNLSTQASTYSWDFGDGVSSEETAPTHTYDSAGTYNIMLTATQCGFSSTVTIPINIPTLNLKKNPISTHITYYPNPVASELLLNINAFESIQLIDISGKIYNPSYFTTTENTTINFANFEPGIYFLKIVKDSKLEIIKVIKK